MAEKVAGDITTVAVDEATARRDGVGRPKVAPVARRPPTQGRPHQRRVDVVRPGRPFLGAARVVRPPVRPLQADMVLGIGGHAAGGANTVFPDVDDGQGQTPLLRRQEHHPDGDFRDEKLLW